MSMTFLCYRQESNACIYTVSEEEMNKTDLKVKLDELVKSPKTVIPAKAGIHK
jgi:hypothetical protein